MNGWTTMNDPNVDLVWMLIFILSSVIMLWMVGCLS